MRGRQDTATHPTPLQTPPLVSCAMIVRDSSATLARALDSIAGHVDEIVIVDTGSLDDTKAIAARYTDRIYDFEWVDDFSAARQHAFDQCRGQWIMHLDSDDVVHHAEKIRSSCLSAKPEITALYWQYLTDRDQHGNITTQFYRERCIRSGSHRWTGRAHEVLIPITPVGKQRDPAVSIEHLGNPTDSSNHVLRNIRILRKALAEEDPVVPRTLFYLGRDLATVGELEEALPILKRYVPISHWQDEAYLAAVIIGYIHRKQGDFDAAIDADLAALKVTPHWPDAYFGLAEDYYFKQEWDRVLHWSEYGQAVPIPNTDLFVNPLTYTYAWRIFYVVALCHRGQYKRALEVTRAALRIMPDDAQHKHNAAYLESVLGTSSEQLGRAEARRRQRAGVRLAHQEATKRLRTG